MDPTERVPFGRTALRVTRLGLGTAPIGGLYEPVSQEVACATIARAYDLGLRLFDTAPLYGHGLAEQYIGRVLSGYMRRSFILSTKVGRLLRAGVPLAEGLTHKGEPFYRGVPGRGLPAVNPVEAYSYDAVLRSVEESLARLGLGHVDILYIHDPDAHYDEALTGAYRALDRLRRAGSVTAIGVGMNQAEMLARFAQDGEFDGFLVAGRYTLLDQSALSKLLPLCLDRKIAVVIGGVFNSGILANPQPGARFNYIPAPQEWVERTWRLQEICRRHDVPLKAAAMQFPFGHPAVTAVVIGARTPTEVEEDVHMFRLEIPADFWRDLRAAGLLAAEVPVPGEGTMTQIRLAREESDGDPTSPRRNCT